MPFVDARGLSIYHEFHGAGAPLLHISGSGGDLRMTAPALHRLNDDFLGLHYDQRGLGQTSLGDHQPTMADFADDAAALCDAVGWDTFRVIGTSFGGMVAQHLAIRHGERIERLVLNCTSPGGDLPSYPLHDLQSLAPGDRAETYLTVLDTRYKPGDSGGIPGLGDFTNVLRESTTRARSGEEALGFTRQLEARRHHDVVADLPRVSVPTLVCSGRYDGIAPPANGERIASLIPDAELDLFDGGHLFMLQEPQAVERAREFLLG